MVEHCTLLYLAFTWSALCLDTRTLLCVAKVLTVTLTAPIILSCCDGGLSREMTFRLSHERAPNTRANHFNLSRWSAEANTTCIFSYNVPVLMN